MAKSPALGKRHAGVALVLCLLLSSAKPAPANECGLPELSTVEVGPRLLCAYGHWLEGPVTIRVVDGKIVANGIQIFPMLHHAIAAEPITAAERTRYAAHDTLMSEIEALQDRMAEGGATKRELQDQDVIYLRSRIDVANVEHNTGDFYDVQFKDGTTLTVGLGILAPHLTPEETEELRCRHLTWAYERLVSRVASGWLQIYASSLHMEVGPVRRIASDFAPVLDRAITGTAPLDSLSWDNSEIPYDVARELRNPRQLDPASEGCAR